MPFDCVTIFVASPTKHARRFERIGTEDKAVQSFCPGVGVTCEEKLFIETIEDLTMRAAITGDNWEPDSKGLHYGQSEWFNGCGSQENRRSSHP
jgi:hypothetical protein